MRKIIVCHIISGDLWAGAEVQIFNIISSQEYRRKIEPICIVLNRGILEKKLKDLNLEVQVYPESENNFFFLLLKIIWFLRDKKVSIIHSHRVKENVLAFFIALICNVKITVKSVYGWTEIVTGIKKIKSNLLFFLDNLLSKYFFNANIVVTKELASKLKNRIHGDKIFVVNNSINLAELRKAEKRTKCKNQLPIFFKNNIIIGTVSRLVPIKGLEYFIRAAHILINELDNIGFVIGGTGPQENELRELCRDLKISKYFYFPGFVSDVYNFISNFHVFVISSLHEGFPTTVLESMAIGIPVVVTNVGGIPEIIRNKYNGIISEKENPQALAESIKILLENRSLYDTIKKNGQKEVLSFYTNQYQGHQVVQLYQKLLIKI